MKAYIIVVAMLLSGVGAWAQTLVAPDSAEPGSMFVVDVTVPSTAGTVTRLSFEPGNVQFMGLVVPTPAVQLVGDSVLEFSTGAGPAGRHQVKFLSFPTASAAVFDFVPPVPGQRRSVAFVAKVEEKRYHWHILAAGLILLVIAWGFWRYQKKNPGLMSTRSLFLNFEELQKAREQFFVARPQEGVPSSTPPSGQPPASPATPVTPAPAGTLPMEVPAVTGDAKDKTGEMPVAASRDLRTLEMPAPAAPKSPCDDAAAPTEEGLLTGKTPAYEMTGVVPPTDVNKTPAGEIQPIPASGPVKHGAGEAPKTVVRSDLSGKRSAPVEPEFLVRLSDASGRAYEGKGREILIGRSPECTIVMTAAEVSRKHLLIRREAGRLVAVPQTNSNTTEINGTRIQGATPIESGATIALGGTAFTVTITG